jgi:hypothetical protein
MQQIHEGLAANTYVNPFQAQPPIGLRALRALWAETPADGAAA